MRWFHARIWGYILIMSVLFYGLLFSALPVEAATGINKQINFQGKVVNSNGTNVANGDYSFVFKLYTVSSGGVAVWTETKTITVTDGVFRTALGSVTSLPGSVDFNTDNIYLGVEFNSDGEMDPRIRFTAVPYAFNALKVAGLTVTDTTGTFTLTAGKTLSVANSLSFAGTDGTTITFQGTDTYVGLATTDVLTNKTIGSTGLIFSGATTDIDAAAGEALVLQGRAASSFNTTAGAISFQAAGTGTVSSVQIGAGGSGSSTPDYLGLDVKSDTGDPAGGYEGAMYYNTFDNKFRCYQGAAWTNCIGTGGGSSVWSDLTLPTANLTLAMAEYTSAFNWDTAATAAAFDGLTMSITNDAGTDATTQRVLAITNANDGGSTGTTERLLVLDNLDTNEAVTTALEIASTGGGAITTALDLSDSDIVTALSIGANDVTATSWSIAGSTGIGTFAGGVFNGNVDMTNDLLLNIGDANTDFTSGGGLTLAGTFDANGDVSIADTNIALDGASSTLTATGALTLTPGGAMILGATTQTASLQGTTIGITSNSAGNDITLTSADDYLFAAAAGSELDYTVAASTVTTGVFDLNIDTSVTGGFSVINNGLTINSGAASGDDYFADDITLTNNDDNANAFGLRIVGAATANAGANAYENGIWIDNQENTVGSMASAIKITSTTDTALTTALDASDAEIVNALSAGANDIIATNWGVAGSTGIGTFAGGVFNGNVDMTNDLLLNIGDANTDFTSGGGLNLAGDLAVNGDDITGDGTALTIQVGGSNTTANVQIGVGGAGSTTPDYFGLDVKSTTGDPVAAGFEGAMYYNTFDNKFRCYQGSAWTDCIGTGGSALWSGLGTPTGNLTLSMAEYTSAFNWDTAATAAAFDGLTMSINNDAGTDGNTQRLLVLTNANDGGATGTTERLLVLDNLDTNEAVTTALEIASTGGGAITTALDLTDSDIVTALSAGANDLAGTSWTITGATGAFDTQGTIQAGSGNITITDATGNLLESAIADGSVYSRLGAAETITGGWTFNTAATIFTTALNANGGLTTSTTNTALTLGANGSGDIVFSNDADTNVQITAGAASGVDLLAISTNGNNVTTTAIDGEQIDFSNNGASAIDNAGLRINITSNNNNASTVLSAINITGITAQVSATEYALNIGTGWDRGLSIGDSTNYVALSSGAAPVYAGTARPSKTITLSPEYAGGVLTTFYGAGTDSSNITGTATSDPVSTANAFKNYYQWTTTTVTPLQYYTVAVRVTLPKDFDAWETSNAFVLNYMTNHASASNNSLDVYLYKVDETTSAVASTTGLSSATWTTTVIDDSVLDDNSAPEWDAADETVMIFLRMGALNSNYVRLGDITLNYKAKF